MASDKRVHHDLETVEEMRLSRLDVTAELFDEVLVDNAVGRRKECKDVRDKMALIETFLPVMKDPREVHPLQQFRSWLSCIKRVRPRGIGQ